VPSLFVEEALDEIALAIERENHKSAVSCGWLLAESPGVMSRWVSVSSSGFGVVGLVANQGRGVGLLKQRFDATEIVSLPRREHHVDRIAESIDQDVDFGSDGAPPQPLA
jgi:hypothetical protein